ncbi:MAG: TIGR02281 family clan AA aspartic protease [Gammaproteobacteria bacterium]
MFHRIACIIFLVAFFQPAKAVDKIIIVGLFKNKAIVQLDGKQRTLDAGKTSPEGVTLISANSKEAVLEINGIRKSYPLGTHIGSRFKGPTGQKTVSIAPDSQGMYWVNGSINDFQVRFVVDTGATVISMNRNDAKRIGLDYRMKGDKSVSSTASGLENVYLVKLKKVKVGDIELQDVTGAVHNSDYPKVILLGNSFLSRLDIKREGGLLQLQKK